MMRYIYIILNKLKLMHKDLHTVKIIIMPWSEIIDI